MMRKLSAISFGGILYRASVFIGVHSTPVSFGEKEENMSFNQIRKSTAFIGPEATFHSGNNVDFLADDRNGTERHSDFMLIPVTKTPPEIVAKVGIQKKNFFGFHKPKLAC